LHSIAIVIREYPEPFVVVYHNRGMRVQVIQPLAGWVEWDGVVGGFVCEFRGWFPSVDGTIAQDWYTGVIVHCVRFAIHPPKHQHSVVRWC